MSKSSKNEYRKCHWCGHQTHKEEGDIENNKFYCNDCLDKIGSINFWEEQELFASI